MKTEVLPPVEIEVKPEWLDYYFQAVGPRRLNDKNGTVSATAIAGRALIKLLEPLNLPTGVIHTQAIVENISPARMGDKLLCEGVVAGLIKRIGVEAMTVTMTVKKPNQVEILKAEMTFKLPGW